MAVCMRHFKDRICHSELSGQHRAVAPIQTVRARETVYHVDVDVPAERKRQRTVDNSVGTGAILDTPKFGAVKLDNGLIA